METGSVSRKIGRGKHTTRHAELLVIDRDSYIMDTPGFSSLYISDMEKRRTEILLSRNSGPMKENAASTAAITRTSRTARSRKPWKRERYMRSGTKTILACTRELQERKKY